MTFDVTIDDGMLNLRPNGVGDWNLRCNLWVRFGKIYCQGSINELELAGMVKIKFKKHYKTQRATQQRTLGHL